MSSSTVPSPPPESMMSVQTMPFSTETFRSSVAPSGTLLSPAMTIAIARVTNYLVRSGWGDQPASQRAERLVLQIAERDADQIGDLESSPADLSRLVRNAIAAVCQTQSDDVRRSVIRPVVDTAMDHPMTVRTVGPLRIDWWLNLSRRMLTGKLAMSK